MHTVMTCFSLTEYAQNNKHGHCIFTYMHVYTHTRYIFFSAYVILENIFSAATTYAFIVLGSRNADAWTGLVELDLDTLISTAHALTVLPECRRPDRACWTGTLCTTMHKPIPEAWRLEADAVILWHHNDAHRGYVALNEAWAWFSSLHTSSGFFNNFALGF